MERALAPATGARDRNVEMVESDRAAIVRALADEDALRVFAQVVAVTGTGLPERSGGSIGINYVTAPWCVASNRAAGQRRCRRRPALDRGALDDRGDGWNELAH